MGATDGSFRRLATSYDTNERNPAKQPKPLAPTAALNSPEPLQETVTFYTTSANSDEALEQDDFPIEFRIESVIHSLLTYEEGGDAQVAARIAVSHAA